MWIRPDIAASYGMPGPQAARWVVIVLLLMFVSGCSARASEAELARPSELPWASGQNADSRMTSFATFRGRQLDVVTTWEDDGTWRGTEVVWALANGSLNGFTGELSVAVPMLANSSNSLKACASGAYDRHFVALGKTLKRYNRANAFVRLGWEGNGDWYPWSGIRDPAAWVTCFRREVAALRSADPAVRIEWNMNKDGRIGAQRLYPGDGYVDVIGVDFFDKYPAYRTQAAWDADYYRTQDGGPRGLGTWLEFARSHGKPLSVPEWGIQNGGRGGGSDNPFYIQKMHDFFAANARYIAYESYFNAQCPAFCLGASGINPQASTRYRKLWGGAH